MKKMDLDLTYGQHNSSVEVCQCISTKDGRQMENTMDHILDFILPPIAKMLLIIIALIVFSLKKQPYWWQQMCCGVTENNKKSEYFHNLTLQDPDLPDPCFAGRFFTCEDIEILNSLKCYQQNPIALFKITLPPLLSLAFCPASLILFEPVVEFFWSPDEFVIPPNINDAISAFLAPAGLVYAIAFGFGLQDAIEKVKQVSDVISDQVSTIKQLALLTCKSQYLSRSQKIEVLISLKSSTILWLKNGIMNGKTKTPVCHDIWKIYEIIQKTQELRNSEVASVILKKIMIVDKYLDYTDIHSSIHIFQWVFLELHGYIAFFGILLIDADSFNLQLTMCILTVFSISLFCYILADFDSALHGAFRVDLDFVLDLPMQLQVLYESTTLQRDMSNNWYLKNKSST